MFRIGLLGLGVMGKRHTEAAAGLPDIELVNRHDPAFAGVAKTDDAAAYQMALAQAMIADPSIDALDLCLPTRLHAPLTIAALTAGKHVLCEKPMAMDLADCQAMIAARQKSVLMIAHVLRFWPAYAFLREVVACRSYGVIQSAKLTRQSGLPTWAPWLLDSEQSGGGILDMLVHDFDQALLLFGEPGTVTAKQDGSPHAVQCSLGYKDGLTVEIAGGWMTGEVPFSMGYELVCGDGTLRFADGKVTFDGQEISLKKADAYAAQLKYFADCCVAGAEPSVCLPESSAAAVDLACRVRDLAARG